MGENRVKDRVKQRFRPDCGVERFLLLLDGPWATLVIRELLHGPRRFTELRDALVGISAHTLTHRLRRFEAHGLVTRTVHAEIPPRVVYELTPRGASLRDILYAMSDWGDAIPEPTIDALVPDAAPLPAAAAASAPA